MRAKYIIQILSKCVCLGAVGVLVQSCAVPSSGGMQPAAPAVANGYSNDAAHSTVAAAPSRSIPKAVERPGLATAQGRQLNSRVNFTSFQRASASKPKHVEAMYYNDEEGVKAMTTRSWKYQSSGLQEAAGGLIEWGVRSSFRYSKNYSSSGKRYVVGKKGKEYSLVVKNKCQSRLEVVLSVDGLSVLSGRKASYGQRGYVINPGQTLVVKGYRTSQNAVHAFKFSSVASSYTNRLHGETRNVGVIGMAVFTEKGVDPWRWSPKVVEKRHAAKPF